MIRKIFVMGLILLGNKGFGQDSIAKAEKIIAIQQAEIKQLKEKLRQIPKICSGSMLSEKIEWNIYNGNKTAAYADIDTSTCGFAATPRYFVSLVGNQGHQWEFNGASAIYAPTKTGFRIYLKNWAAHDAVKDLNEQKIYVDWFGVQNHGE
jgi:hypothetical protein